MGELTIQQVEVVSVILPILAVIVTTFRLVERTRQGRLWLDDLWAVFAMLFMIALLVTNALYLYDYALFRQGARVALYYMVAQFFYAIIWASRISIMFTIVRLAINVAVRRMLTLVVVVFFIAWMVLFAQVFWTCEAERGWKTQPRPQCNLGRNVAIAQIITDVLGDFILIVAPFRLIYKVRLSRHQKIRILSIFSTSAITTVVSLTHAYYVFSVGELKESLTAIVEVSICLIVANLSVVVAFLFRISTEDSQSFSPPQLRSIVTFGSKPIRKKQKQTTVIGVETTTIRLEDFSTYTNSGAEAEPENKAEVGTSASEKASKPGIPQLPHTLDLIIESFE